MTLSKTLIGIFCIAAALTSGEAYSEETPLSEPVFLELVYQIAAQPFESESFIETSRSEFLGGYVLDRDTAPAVLYPASGAENALSGNILTGYRIVNGLDAHLSSPQFLKTFPGAPFTFHTTETIGTDLLFQKLDLWDSLLEPLQVEIAKVDQSAVNLRAEGKDFRLAPGESAFLWNGEEEYTASDFLKAYLDLRKVRSAAEISPKALQEIQTDLKVFFPDDKPKRFYLRLSAHFLAPVKLASFDALTEWNRSAENLESGRYVESLKNLERVLLAVPGHPEALWRWGKINQLVQSGKTPATLAGRLVFPSGFPTDAEKNLWQKYHEGFAMLGLPSSDSDTALALQKVRNGSFTITAPAGSYRLRVLVPGFEPFEKSIELAGNMELEVPLRKT